MLGAVAAEVAERMFGEVGDLECSIGRLHQIAGKQCTVQFLFNYLLPSAEWFVPTELCGALYLQSNMNYL